MPESSNYASNSQTFVRDADKFTFECIEKQNGVAEVIRFRTGGERISAGDVLLVLSGADIHFHGMVGKIDGDWAIATDRRGSLLPADVQ